jgi:polysaccharide biosynthesis/export protein
MSRVVLISLALAAVAPAGALAAQGGPAAKSENAKAESARPESARSDPVLRPGDLIRVQVFQEEDINKQGEVRISQESTIALPLIGSVDLKQKTVRQAEELIRKLYHADYFVNPQVSVHVIEYAPRTVDVIGMLNTPGVVPFPKEEGLTLLRAIASAGGFNRLADPKRVILKRTMSDGKVETYRIDCEKLTRGETNETWPLQPGDLITVPERVI